MAWASASVVGGSAQPVSEGGTPVELAAVLAGLGNPVVAESVELVSDLALVESETSAEVPDLGRWLPIGLKPAAPARLFASMVDLLIRHAEQRAVVVGRPSQRRSLWG
jgi:hypothetical protein